MSATADLVPVFPLPNTVFFPGTCLPLHVFEPRYRAMVEDAAQGRGRIAVTLLEPGWEEEYAGCPPMHRIGTVGRIHKLVRLDDGRFDIGLEAQDRVAFHEVPSGRAYRMARLVPCPEHVPDESDDDVRRAKLELLAVHAFLVRELTLDKGPILLDESLSFRNAVNAVCACLPVEAERRQELLEIDCLLERQRRATALVRGALETLLLVRGASGRRPETRDLN